MTAVKLNRVSKKIDNHLILNDITLATETGEFVVIIGPSGCGKSTLLRLVAGLEEVTEGEILINDRCVNHIPPAKRDMAMVFQSYALYPHMTVYENMAYGLKMRRFSKAAIEERVSQAAELLQLSTYLNRKPQELSGGQRQRVAMGRAIVRSPSVFLFDEPLSNLDTQLRSEMRYEIKCLHQRLQTTCLYVTHDQTEAMTMGSRVVVLNQGRVEQMDSPQMLYQRPASLFVARFTGHYPLNEISAQIDLNQSCLKTDVGGLVLPLSTSRLRELADRPMLLAIRAEHIRLKSSVAENSLPVKIELVDDMGSEKLVHTRSLCGKLHLAIRVSAETNIQVDVMGAELDIEKINLYEQKTGMRLGGWNDQTRTLSIN